MGKTGGVMLGMRGTGPSTSPARWNSWSCLEPWPWGKIWQTVKFNNLFTLIWIKAKNGVWTMKIMHKEKRYTLTAHLPLKQSGFL